MKNKLITVLIIFLIVNFIFNSIMIVKMLSNNTKIDNLSDIIDKNLDKTADSLSSALNATENLYFDVDYLRSKISEMDVILVEPDVPEEKDGYLPFTVEIWVDENNTIHRASVPEGSDIAWVFIYNGDEVLARNAENETEYTYYDQKSGVYTVYIATFIDQRYMAVSNIVSYTVEN